MGKASRYFKGVGKEMKRVRWPKSDEFIAAIVTVILVSVFAAIFLLIEDLGASTILKALRDAFTSLRG